MHTNCIPTATTFFCVEAKAKDFDIHRFNTVEVYYNGYHEQVYLQLHTIEAMHINQALHFGHVASANIKYSCKQWRNSLREKAIPKFNKSRYLTRCQIQLSQPISYVDQSMYSRPHTLICTFFSLRWPDGICGRWGLSFLQVKQPHTNHEIGLSSNQLFCS